jgi:cell wall-associated NlpC family hydrolase
MALKTWGEKALSVAMTQIGLGEETANNKGRHVAKYTRGLSEDMFVLWCSYFVVWCFEAAYVLSLGLTEWEHLSTANKKACPIRRTGSALKLYEQGVKVESHEVEPGDLVLWKRKGGHHIGIVAQINKAKNTFRAIEGNRGTFPAEVDDWKHAFDEPALLGFSRIKG